MEPARSSRRRNGAGPALLFSCALALCLGAGVARGRSWGDGGLVVEAVAPAVDSGAGAPRVDAAAVAHSRAPGGAACGLSCCDSQVDIIEQLLGHLEAAKQQNTRLRDGLLRAERHAPVLLVNPLGGPSNTAWQVATLVATLLCLSALAREARAKRHVRQLQQLLREKEAGWRRCVDFLARSAKQCGANSAQGFEVSRRAGWHYWLAGRRGRSLASREGHPRRSHLRIVDRLQGSR